MSVTAIATPETATKGGPADADAPKGKKSKKKLVIILVLVLALAGGGYTMFKPKPAAAPVPGTVVPLDPIQINLASDHYLRVGIALQLTAKVKEADGSKALDALIDEFSGKPLADVINPAKRRKMKIELEHTLGELYEKEVMKVYFTEFVTQ
jgi:flagellar FliL protein